MNFNFFNKKRVWTKVINSDSQLSDYNQFLINEFYEKVHKYGGRILSLQSISDINSEKVTALGQENEEDSPYIISSYPTFYITYSSKKEVPFNENTFKDFYNRSLEGKVEDIKSESFEAPLKN